MIANPNPNLPKRLQWYIVLAALTCVSASPSTVEPKTIFAGSAALKQPLGVVGQSDARVKRYLRRNSDATESMNDENEDRGGDVASTIDQGLAARITESVEAGVTPEVSTAIDQGLAAKVGESVVIPSVTDKDHNPAAKVEEAIATSVTHEVPAAVNHDQATKVEESVEASAIPSVPGNTYNVFYQEFRKAMGDQIEFYKNRGDLFKNDQYTKWSKSVDETLLHMQENYKSLKRLKREYPQVEEWQRDGKSGDDVFDLLEFPDKGQDMFATEAWSLWVAYMTYLETQKELEDQREIATVIFSVLKNRFSSEDLPKLVATAKNVDRTKELAAIWEQSLWRIAKRTPDDVFDLLKLKEKGDAVFESPEFENWALYVKELNNGRSRDDDFELACQLYRHYGPDVERLLEQSEKMAIEKKDKVTKAFVNKMQNEFEMIKSLEEMSPAEMELEETSSVEMELEETSPGEMELEDTSPVDMDIEESSPVEMEVEETSHEKKRLGKRLRTSSPADGHLILKTKQNAGRIRVTDGKLELV
ncbi:unnamed protein product [Peronospora effusa]|nr:unnamed protein product [Peronospora effusa]